MTEERTSSAAGEGPPRPSCDVAPAGAEVPPHLGAAGPLRLDVVFPAQCPCGHIYLEKYQFSEPNAKGEIGFCWCGFCLTKRMVSPLRYVNDWSMEEKLAREDEEEHGERDEGRLNVRRGPAEPAGDPDSGLPTASRPSRDSGDTP